MCVKTLIVIEYVVDVLQARGRSGAQCNQGPPCAGANTNLPSAPSTPIHAVRRAIRHSGWPSNPGAGAPMVGPACDRHPPPMMLNNQRPLARRHARAVARIPRRPLSTVFHAVISSNRQAKSDPTRSANPARTSSPWTSVSGKVRAVWHPVLQAHALSQRGLVDNHPCYGASAAHRIRRASHPAQVECAGGVSVDDSGRTGGKRDCPALERPASSVLVPAGRHE
jgi:hypothetical protein